MVKFILKNKIKDIATQLNTEATLDTKFEQEYLLPNVTEESLLEYGFTFINYDSLNKYPIYRLENLEAIFSEGILHIYEITT